MEVFVLESKKKLKSLHGFVFEKERIIKTKSKKYYILKTKRKSTTFLYVIIIIVFYFLLFYIYLIRNFFMDFNFYEFSVLHTSLCISYKKKNKFTIFNFIKKKANGEWESKK